MRRHRKLVLLCTLGLAAVVAAGCAKKEAPAAAAANPSTAETRPDAGKIPVTTASAEARTEFLQGRDLAEKLRVTDSIAHFEKAVALDPSFALAELNLANSSPSAKGFFEHLGKAVSLADKASEGERLLILAAQAGANNDPVKQKEYLDKLLAAHPNDERAHFNMGGYYFGQQEFPQAIEHYKKATELAPDYSTAFNILGYAYRQNGDFENAEKAFLKYIQLIPGDPNPYDSYAELLLKMGRFDESIAQYRKALAIEPNFLASHFGIAADLMYMGKPDEAAVEIAQMTKKARNDGERRTALFAQTIVNVDRGQMSKALVEADKQYSVAEKNADPAAMAGDLNLKGNILLEMGKAGEAASAFDRSLKLIEGSSLSEEIKNNNRRVSHFNRARVALARKDAATAKTEAAEFRKGAEASKNPAQVRLAHELDGMIALAEKDYEKAVSEFQLGNQQNPQNLYRLCEAYKEKGDAANAKRFCTQAAEFHSLPQLNYAFVRTKAKAAAEKG